MSFTKTHTRKDNKVDVNLVTVTEEGTAIYHRFWTQGKKEVTALWGACPIERFNRDFVPA